MTEQKQQVARLLRASRMSGVAKRPIILVLILVVCIVGLGYDYLVARPGCEQAHVQLQKVLDQAKSDQKTVDEDAVEKALNKKPAETRKGKHYTWTRYSWQAGAPWRTYDVWVVYHMVEGKLCCRDISKNVEPTMFSLDYEETVTVSNTGEPDDAAKPARVGMSRDNRGHEDPPSVDQPDSKSDDKADTKEDNKSDSKSDEKADNNSDDEAIPAKSKSESDGDSSE